MRSISSQSVGSHFSIAFLFAAALVQGVPTHKKSLLARRTQVKDPGYNKNYGVTAGIPSEDMGAMGDDGSKHDATLDRNVWTSDSMSYNFPFLDNMEPVAPMDRVHNGDGAYGMDSVHVSKYLNPDAFPTVVGEGCKCETATKESPRIKCECGKKGDKDHYAWLKDTPVPGTNKYTLEPADITYRGGNYWDPNVRGGIAAPADSLPDRHYPNVAPSDRTFPLPVSASGDRIGIKYSRYMDQVQARVEECDTVSKECTVVCKPGDDVVVALGNIKFNAKVVKTFVGNAVQVSFTPNMAVGAIATTTCPLTSACTAFRYCRAPGQQCVQQKDRQSNNWQGMLVTTHSCPAGTQVCGSVDQVVLATFLKKNGKACKAGAR